MRPHTLSEAARRLMTEPLDKVIPEFLDGFYSASGPAAQVEMLRETPALTGTARTDALLGAIAEYLTKQLRLGVAPAWSSDPARTLDQPWHTTTSTAPGMIEYLTFASPAEFRHRNIFTEEEPLRRARGPR